MNDRQLPVRQPRILNSAERNNSLIPQSFWLAGIALNLVSRLHSARVLGHNPILEDGAVIDAITGFLRDG